LILIANKGGMSLILNKGGNHNRKQGGHISIWICTRGSSHSKSPTRGSIAIDGDLGG
jgi:hypothetical protein